MMKKIAKNSLRVALVVPHIFLHRDILPKVIFSPGMVAINLAESLDELGVDLTLFSPGPVNTRVKVETADLSLFESELAGRNDSYMDLLKKHPFTFVTLARQVQAEMIAKAYQMANEDKFDLVHIFTNEEETALPFAGLCNKPVVFTHHDPFNFLVKYKSLFPKYKDLNWISISMAQRRGMPVDTNWVGNVYHGLDKSRFKPLDKPSNDYYAYLGRIIEPKGLHLAIAAAKQAGFKLKIAGKHYSGQKDSYWQDVIKPDLNDQIEFIGFIKDDRQIESFLGNARALIVPSLFEEPFGMVSIEALACGTPVIGLDSGALSEVIESGVCGYIVPKGKTDKETVNNLIKATYKIGIINRSVCRQLFEERFTLERMAEDYLNIYKQL